MEEAASVVLDDVEDPRQQATLLGILGVFAEPLVDPVRFVQLMGEERLMESALMNLLMERKTAQLEREYAERLTAELAVREQRAAEQALLQAVEDAVVVRFPATSIALVAPLQDIHDPAQLQQLNRAILRAPDQATVEAILREATAGSAR